MNNRNLFKRIVNHLNVFWLPWLLVLAMLTMALSFLFSFQWNWILIIWVLMGVFCVVLVLKPMNIIYGLIGTRGNIGQFFLLFFFINFLFASIYYFAFFKEAGITYDTNQPHVEFLWFGDHDDFIVPHPATDESGTIPEVCKNNNRYYRIDFQWVLQNTFLTALMQGPTDFFSISTIFTSDYPEKDINNYQLSNTFHWFLIFHIFVSWILLGVFISMIYQKFRKS